MKCFKAVRAHVITVQSSCATTEDQSGVLIGDAREWHVNEETSMPTGLWSKKEKSWESWTMSHE